MLKVITQYSQVMNSTRATGMLKLPGKHLMKAVKARDSIVPRSAAFRALGRCSHVRFLPTQTHSAF
jgi:hypothetical protein